jgi:vancomycin aglycone glucosyltransferase
MIEGTVATQFETITAAAQGCDIIVGATTLQIAAPSVAEKMGIPYVFAVYCPAVLPSPHHAPPVLGMLGDKPTAAVDYRELWIQDARRWNDMWGPLLSPHRARLGLSPVGDVLGHILTDRPWLAVEPARPRSSSPKCTTSTTGRNASITSASGPRTHPARRLPTR